MLPLPIKLPQLPQSMPLLRLLPIPRPLLWSMPLRLTLFPLIKPKLLRLILLPLQQMLSKPLQRPPLRFKQLPPPRMPPRLRKVHRCPFQWWMRLWLWIKALLSK